MRRAGIKFVDVSEHFQTKGVLVRPVLVDSRFADTGTRRDGIHAGRIDPALGKQLRRCFQYLAMRSLAETSLGHESNLDLRKSPGAQEQKTGCKSTKYRRV